jgi:hypothetical protein
MDDVVERLRWEFDLANVDRDVNAIVALLMAGEMPNHFPTIARILSRKTTSVLDSSARRAAKRCLGAGIETAMGRPNESAWRWQSPLIATLRSGCATA